MAPSSARRCSTPLSAPDLPDDRPASGSPGPAGGLIFVLVGPGGAGKGTVIRHLLERDHNLWLSRSWTTRLPRPGETEDEYHFVDRATFEEHAANGGFLEHAEILDHLYGTPIPEPPPGSDVVLEIDIQGANQVLAVRPDAVVILLEAPSEDEQAARLRGRGDSAEHVERRIDLGRREVVEARQVARADVVNDDLDRTVERLLAIIGQARSADARPEEPTDSSPTHEGA